MEITTVLAVLFVIALCMVGLHLIFETCYRPYALLKYEIAARRYASGLWFKAYTTEDTHAREKLFALSEKIDTYATTIRENRIALKDFHVCIATLDTIPDEAKRLDALQKIDDLGEELFAGNLFLAFVILFTLAVRYPLVISLFCLHAWGFFFLASQWKKVKKYFVVSEIEEMKLQSMPT